MRLPKFTYFRPTTVAEVCSLLSEYRGEARVLAGGTALMVDLGQRLVTPKYIISLNSIPRLSYIEDDRQRGLRIGACTTIDHLNTSAVIKERYPILDLAARGIGIPAVRYTGTVGGNLSLDTRCIYYNQSDFWRQVRPPCFKRNGNICYAVKGSQRCYAVCQADLAPVLLALEAKVKLVQSTGERIVSLSEFFTGKGERPNVVRPEEIITEIQLPPPSENTIGSYQKLRIREAIDFPLAAVAMVLDMDRNKVCRKAKLVLGAVASAPVEVGETENILKGKKVNDVLIDEAAEAAFKSVHPVDNLSIDASYRRKMTRVLVKRALKQTLG